MNPITTLDAESAEKTERTQSYPGGRALPRWENADLPSATFAALQLCVLRVERGFN